MTIKKLNILLIAILLVGSLAVFIPNASATVTWTYDAPSNTATASGSGSTNFTALVAADTAGGWGKFTADATGTQIICAAKIIIGDGTNACAFSDSNKQIIFTSAARTAVSQKSIQVNDKSTLTLGILQDLNSKKVSDGCSFIDLSTYYGWLIGPNTDSATCIIYLYNCHFVSNIATNVENWIEGIRIWDCSTSHLTYVHFSTYASTPCDVHNLIVSWGYVSIRRPRETVVIDGFSGSYQYRGIWFQTNGGTIKNAVFSGTGSSFVRLDDVDDPCYLINVVSPAWTFQYLNNPLGKVYRQYEFDLTVLNGEVSDVVEDANVTLSRSGSVLGSWLTNSTGQIPTQIETYGYYDQSHGDAIQGADDPFYLTITHEDWGNYTSKFYITDKMSLVVSMQEAVDVTPDPSVYQTIDTGNNMAIIAGMFVAIIVFVVTIIIAKGRS